MSRILKKSMIAKHVVYCLPYALDKLVSIPFELLIHQFVLN